MGSKTVFSRFGKAARDLGHRARGHAPPWARAALGRALGHDDVSTWYDPDYRLPISGIGTASGIEPRRADFVAWYLLDRLRCHRLCFEQPPLATYEQIGRVHTEELLRSLTLPGTLARVFASDAADVPIDEVMRSVRLAIGGTVAAARRSLRFRMPTLNLSGGFHHAGPNRAGALCPLNDIAIAIAGVRADGFSGQINIIDLDAHPPDGTAECVAGDDRVWLGSLSGSDWGPLAGDADETVLPQGCGDTVYLEALRALLARMPAARLVFVLAGGDVLAGDRFGLLGLSLAGARQRDLLVAESLAGVGSVWLPGGGYTDNAWRCLAGTALAVMRHSADPVPADYDPLGVHFAAIARRLGRDELSQPDPLDSLELAADLASLGLGARGTPRLLGLWTASGIEYALHRYGVLGHLRRLGYDQPRIALDHATTGERMRVFASADGHEYLLAEAVFDTRDVSGRKMLFLNWLNLRNPRARFAPSRAPLPGQETPGLGIAKEALEIILEMAKRLGLAGVAFRPSWFHTAAVNKRQFRFVDPERQGRFEALVRDAGGRPVADVTRALAEGRVRLNGEPYQWEADFMAMGIDLPADERARIDAERERVRFEIDSPADAARVLG